MAQRLLVLHGPNLALLAEGAGTRLQAIDAALRTRAAELGVQLHIVSSNHEGALLDALHAERTRIGGVVVGPGALALSGHALAEGLALAGVPAVEVHLGSGSGRSSVLRGACVAQISGKGAQGYLLALERLAGGKARHPAAARAAVHEPGRAPGQAPGRAPDDEEAPGEARVQTGKTLGRKPVNRLVERKGRGEVSKTLGRKPAAKAAPKPPANTLAAKTLGRAAHLAGEDEAAQLLSRALVRHRIAERLSGHLSPSALATWARTHWLDVQRGAPVESGQRELLEETLQRLTLATLPASRLTDEQLIELMTQLDT
jgi:3-dehydroquinate dehydratase II